ncbi:hypothetical protein K466DRAFT_11958 [Polyporus arcularius HHB13444]|uniref:Uncharacterized protein n=1 Tax=Polyporus arcularius HHB13444 TaxID=1314778 RepID=A0A5C3NT50_9APHY|nr:hypothetical protein K466DRAFT_11958 [Polyporus arcularius HHB13444]
MALRRPPSPHTKLSSAFSLRWPSHTGRGRPARTREPGQRPSIAACAVIVRAWWAEARRGDCGRTSVPCACKMCESSRPYLSSLRASGDVHFHSRPCGTGQSSLHARHRPTYRTTQAVPFAISQNALRIRPVFANKHRTQACRPPCFRLQIASHGRDARQLRPGAGPSITARLRRGVV